MYKLTVSCEGRERGNNYTDIYITIRYIDSILYILTFYIQTIQYR